MVFPYCIWFSQISDSTDEMLLSFGTSMHLIGWTNQWTPLIGRRNYTS